MEMIEVVRQMQAATVPDTETIVATKAMLARMERTSPVEEDAEGVLRWLGWRVHKVVNLQDESPYRRKVRELGGRFLPLTGDEVS